MALLDILKERLFGDDEEEKKLPQNLPSIAAPPAPIDVPIVPQEQIPLPAPPITQPTQPVAPAAPVASLPPVSQSDEYLKQMQDIQNKDYGIREEPVLNVQGQEVGTNQIRGKDRKKKWGLWEKVGNAGLGFLVGLGKGGLLGAGAEAVKGGTDRNYYKKYKDSQDLPPIQRNYEQAVVAENNALNQEMKRAQIGDIPINNELKREEIEERRASRESRLKNQSLNKLNSVKYYDPANPAHRRLAESAGLNPDELKGWDDRNPVTKQVAGVTYQYNRSTGKFEPSDIPTDESKTLTDYKVQMPNGEMRTYKVAQKDAANFATQMYALGARLEQQERQFQQRLKLDQAKFAEAKKQYVEAADLRERQFQALQEARAKNDAQETQRLELAMAESDRKLEAMMNAARKGKTEGELDDDQYNEIESYVNSKRNK